MKRWPLILLALGLLPAFAKADIAVVVGVQKYHVADMKELKGCENDAKAVGAALKGLGFDVKYVLGEAATHTQILKAITDAGKKIKPTENFVFFFAGHGCQLPVGILPVDAQKEGNFITPSELRDAILTVKGSTRTVILDSCFSGAMARSKGLSLEVRARVYEPRSTGRVDADEPSAGVETSNPFAIDSRIGYVCAALKNEPALETDLNGVPHGVFTTALLPHLAKPLQPWGAVTNQVRQTMMALLEKSGNQQFPMLAPLSISSKLMFSTQTAGITPPQSVIDLYATDHVSDADFKLESLPAKTTFQAGEKLSLNFKFSKPGYLVIIGNVGGRYYVTHPSSGNADQAAVATTFAIPDASDPDKVLTFNEFGEDHIQCLYFTDKARAQAVIDAMRDTADGLLLGQFKQIQLDKAANLGSVYTRRMSFAVGRNLVGGKPAKDLAGLLTKIKSATDPKSLWLGSKVNAYYKDSNPADPERDQALLLTLINLAIQDPKTIDDGTTDLDLKPETKALLAKKPTGAELVKLNRWMVEDAFPMHFDRTDKDGKRQ